MVFHHNEKRVSLTFLRHPLIVKSDNGYDYLVIKIFLMKDSPAFTM